MRAEDLRRIGAQNVDARLRMPYPGRAIALGRSDRGVSTAYYELMGRNPNTRNRELTGTRGVISAIAHLESESVGESNLTLYDAVMPVDTPDGWALVVTNGTHTNDIAKYVAAGVSLEEAMLEHIFEPDPLKTPRIAGVIWPDRAAFPKYELAIVTEDPEVTGKPKHDYYPFDYKDLRNGLGVCISTYDGDEVDPQSFRDRPYLVRFHGEAPEDILVGLKSKSLHGVAETVVSLQYGLFTYSITDRWLGRQDGFKELDQ